MLSRRNLSEICAAAVLLAVVAFFFLRTSKTPEVGKTVVVWVPAGPICHPDDSVSICVPPRLPSMYLKWEMIARAWKIPPTPILRFAYTESREEYAGPDSSVITVDAHGDTLYWVKRWAMVGKEGP
jgi:hypothetical protein